MDARLTRTKEGFLLSSLPPELASASSVEIIPLKSGIFLLCAKGGLERASAAAPAAKEDAVSEKERAVLQKLLAIRFDRRTPSEVAKLLSREERETLEALIGKRIVALFKGKKYQDDGVYNVSDFGYAATRQAAPRQAEPHGALKAAQPQHAEMGIPISSPEHLEKKGWMVLESDGEAKNFAAAFPDKMKSGEVRGTRGFDRRYYFVKSDFLLSIEKRVLSSLSKDKTEEELAAETGMEPEGCRALLAHLCESGDVLEKQKGKYARA